MTVLVVVPGERHVERLAREGTDRAETRTSLRARLAAAFLPDTRFADARETRLALAMALHATSPSSGTKQLDLFGASAAANEADAAPLAILRRRGGASWVRLVESIDDALGTLRARGATADDLDRTATRSGGVTAARARTLSIAMRALDDALAKSGARDGRLLGRSLAAALASVPAEEIAAQVGATRLRARWLLAWDPSDLAWWRALDERLARVSGWARVAVPSFDRRLEGSRERDPLETVADDLARALDAAPEPETIAMVLGDLAGDPPPAVDHVRLVCARDPVEQARAVAAVVGRALDRGAAVERIAIGIPSADERTLAPLRRAVEDAGIVSYEARGAPPSAAAVVVAALLALDAARTLDRRLVARLLRSGYVDPARILDDAADRREAARALVRVADALESAATAAGEDPAERLVATAVSARKREPERAAVELAARAVTAVLRAAPSGGTRRDHVRRARVLWSALGIGARAGRGGLAAFARDEAPSGVPRAERLAIARDARAWEALTAAVDAYENVGHATGALDQEIDDECFRLELAGVLDDAATRPGAGRAGAIRIARLADLAGDDLDLLVVVDANDGVLPRDVSQDEIVSDALGAALEKTTRGAFVALPPAVARARELAALATAAADARAVVVTFTTEDGSGALLAPSAFVDVLTRAGAAVESGRDAAVEIAAPAVTEEVARRVRRERIREAFFLDPARPRSDTVAELDPRPEIAAILSAETGGGGRSLAVTGLERFARCPFMGYAHVILAAREAERREEVPDAREEGMLVHEALAAAFTETRDEWSKRPRARDGICERGLAAADAVLAAAARHAPLGAVARLRVRDAVRATLELAIDDETWDFTAAEQSFGGKDTASWPAFDLGDVVLRGTIDRVDRAHDGRAVRVIDYKRSKSTVTAASSGLGETALQVPLYASVASRRFGLPAKGLYLATQLRDVTAGVTPSVKAEKRMDDLVARESAGATTEIERRALAVVRSIREGHLAPTPADESECRMCSVSGGCRKPRFAMAPDEGDEEQLP